jgi:hypothetical protein
MESKLIEVMKMKMQMIQFVSIVNLIQMKLIKVIRITCPCPDVKSSHMSANGRNVTPHVIWRIPKPLHRRDAP